MWFLTDSVVFVQKDNLQIKLEFSDSQCLIIEVFYCKLKNQNNDSAKISYSR